jgi:hypothetical protein
LDYIHARITNRVLEIIPCFLFQVLGYYLYFSIGGNVETALFDTDLLINVINPATADKIEIERYPQAPNLNQATGYIIPMSNCFNCCTRICLHQPPTNAMNIISAAQFVDNSIEFTLREHSTSFSNLGYRDRKYSSWIH